MRIKSRWLWVLGVCLLLLALTQVAASGMASMALERWVFSGGESSRVSGKLALSGTTGQPVVSRSSAGAVTLFWGYWGPGSMELYLPMVLKNV